MKTFPCPKCGKTLNCRGGYRHVRACTGAAKASTFASPVTEGVGECVISVGAFRHVFRFGGMEEFGLGVAVFRQQVDDAKKYVPLALLTGAAAVTPPERTKRATPAPGNHRCTPAAAPAAGNNHAPIAVIGFKYADFEAVKDEFTQHDRLRLVLGDQAEDGRLTGCANVVIARFASPTWYAAVNERFSKPDIHVVPDTDGVIAACKKLGVE